MKYLLTALSVISLIGCRGPKPVGHLRCWTITAVISHDIARSDWYYLKLKDTETERTSHLDTSIFRPYAAGDEVCIQKYDDGGIASTRYTPVP